MTFDIDRQVLFDVQKCASHKPDLLLYRKTETPRKIRHTIDTPKAKRASAEDALNY